MTMKSIKDLAVGDDVYLTDPNHPACRVKVGKVGRKNLFLNGLRHRASTPYDRETGRAKDAYGNARLVTVEQFKLNAAAQSARDRLGKYGVTLDRSMSPERAIAALEALQEWIKSIETGS